MSRRKKTLNSNLLNSAYKLTLCHILPERRGWVNMIMLTITRMYMERLAIYSFMFKYWKATCFCEVFFQIKTKTFLACLITDQQKGRCLTNICLCIHRSTRTYLQQLCTITGCRLEDLPEAVDDRDEWQER